MDACGTSRGFRGPPPQGARLGCSRQGGPIPLVNAAREGPTWDPGRPRPATSGSHLPHSERGEDPQAQVSAAAPPRSRRSRDPPGNIRFSQGSGVPLSWLGVSVGR
ncbi:hypothetical protein NDU88_003230 [Pleurodeles waltl]|uniref:Uncharacterized protein n=1 Tax=Pleurodeles waltl TaxID=8319 RepID=A0AAV7WRT3_PLEWA|nr:hypothetical protein NDU88_003230 [Pleurodeles waltl]